MRLYQLFGAFASLFLFLFIVRSIQKNLLKERYALLWMVSSALLFVLSLWKELLDWVAALLGIASPVNFLFLVQFLFLFLICIHFSFSISKIKSAERRLAQELSLVKNKLNELHDKVFDRNAKL